MSESSPQPDRENSTSDGEEFALEEFFVAPWGLANEERPLHLLWEGEIQELELRLAEPVELVDGYNISGDIADFTVESPEDGGNHKLIRIHQSDFLVPGYFNTKFKIPEIFENAMSGQPIQARFILGNGETRELNSQTFTIRPQLKLLDSPQEIILNDDDESVILPIHMQYIGFGMAEVEMDIEGEGDLISEGESIHHDILRAMAESGIATKESEKLGPIPEDWKQDHGVEIPDKELRELGDEIRELAFEDKLREEFDDATLEWIAEALEKGDDHEADIYEHIEVMLLDSILNAVDRHPAENVRITNPNAHLEIESRVREFVLSYELKDKVGNEYQSIRVPIDIKDERSDGGILEVEVETKWDHHKLNPDEILGQLEDEI
ncbi:hypothetical protein [Halomarina oriensis]|uniref:Uncharacterized protein n=1 Tax=Halomarina oriensis TaxID=671145 RepID=A0A6B0GG47_9EURY|nr:hypothetical protein [Halomarina oriensis]MWG33792.1 hypothetical protein [Halomarina oriensis]